MKRFFFLFSIIFVCNTLTAQTTKNDWQKLSLKDKPKVVLISNGVQKPKTYIFNNFGNIIQKKNECTCNGTDNTIDYTYTTENKLLEKTTTIGTQIVEKIKYLYDSNGEVTENYIIGQESMEAEMSDYIPGQKETTQIDNNGNLTNKTITYPDDNKTKIVENHYKYDKRKNWIQMDTYIKEMDETKPSKKESITRKIQYF